MKLNEYTQYDATGLAALVARGEVTPRELARLAAEAIALANPALGAVVETYPDRIEALDEAALGRGPGHRTPSFRGRRPRAWRLRRTKADGGE